ncbi:hypothetical protein VTJ04DRAFT_8288 [Mycothermus thermophilus]|uniref:uncharacterized protein n=1 Tax=Humicola insolens TaxID=85995 RepID=UPI003743C51E
MESPVDLTTPLDTANTACATTASRLAGDIGTDNRLLFSTNHLNRPSTNRLAPPSTSTISLVPADGTQSVDRRVTIARLTSRGSLIASTRRRH